MAKRIAVKNTSMESDYETAGAPYKRLAAAIIIQAVRDYRRVKDNRKNDTDTFLMQEVESFFRSPWFAILSDMDGESCLQQLKEEEYIADVGQAKRYSGINLNMSKRGK